MERKQNCSNQILANICRIYFLSRVEISPRGISCYSTLALNATVVNLELETPITWNDPGKNSSFICARIQTISHGMSLTTVLFPIVRCDPIAIVGQNWVTFRPIEQTNVIPTSYCHSKKDSNSYSRDEMSAMEF